MKALLLALLLILTLPACATTWYVRADGGTRYSAATKSGQCTGTTDAAYPGSGVNQPCAINDPRFLYSTGSNTAYVWAIAGGDTVLLRGGPWRIGQNNATSCGPFSNACAADNAFIPSPPAGTAAQPTTFRGENYASCTTKTQLFGGYSVNGVFNLRDTNHVQLQCLEITDHSQCTTIGIRKPISCDAGIIDDFAKTGILTNQNTHDVTLQDLDIHGMRDNGINGAIGGSVTATRVRIAFNGSSGWNFDDGFSTKSVDGQMKWSYVTIEGNGCIEEYPIAHTFPAAYCYDDGNGGYGDGVGTPDTQISFAVDHSVIRYNTQDGLDLLHTTGSNITVNTSLFYGNMGQQLKLGPMATTNVTNNLFLTNCKRMSATMAGAPSGWNAGLSDFCRAQAGVVMVQRGQNGGGGSYTWQDNDFVGYAGDAMFEVSACTDTFVSAPTTDCTSPNITFQNNIMVGYPYVVPTYLYGELPPSGTAAGDSARFKTLNHNVYYNMRICPTETGSSCGDPHLKGEPTFTPGTPIAETLFDGVNFALTSASTNAIGKGIQIPGITTDFNGAARGSVATIGALVYSAAGSGSTVGATASSAAQDLLTATPASVSVGQSVVLRATLSGDASTTPTGTVTFSYGAGTVQATLNSGVATATVTFPSAGSFATTATYSGDGTYAATTSNTAPITVLSPTTVAITVAQPHYGFNVLPGSTRRIFATVTNGTTDQVAWTLRSGSAVLSSASGSWIDVTAPASGSSCKYTSANSGYGVTSATTFVVQATSVDDPTKATSISFNVCNPATQVSIVPVHRTLYADQPANLQSFVLGNVNTNVQWAIVTQPRGGDGKLVDSTLRDAVFYASVAGRYTLTATSVGAPTQSATAILYVTGNNMPYRATALGTEPVDCTVDPALLGQVYDVGPSQTYHQLASLPLLTMAAGSTIRVHNEDTSGLNPTTYHEFLQLSTHAAFDQPLRLCGVPDSTGHLPILDASGATGNSTSPAGAVTVHSTADAASWPTFTGPTSIEIEGLQIRNANASTTYTSSGASAAAWPATAACIAVSEGQNVSVVGNDLSNCGNGGISTFFADDGWGASNLDSLWEGNHLHGNGVVASTAGNQLSVEAWNEVVQFNLIDGYLTGALGANIKSRGIGDVFRYNELGDGPIRQMDLVDVHNALPFMSFAAFLSDTSLTAAIGTAGVYPADRIAAEQEAWNSHFVYGNLYQDSTSISPIHFAEDLDGGEGARKGSLFWYHNTYNRSLCTGCTASSWALFDTSAGAGTYLPQVEYGNVQAFDNILWMDAASRPGFSWNDNSAFIGTSGLNLLPTGWGTNNQSGGAGSGWDASEVAYQNAQKLALHLTGFTGADLLTTSTQTFDPTAFLLRVAEPAGDTLPSAICAMPTRFAYLPTLNFAVPRISAPNLGAADTIQQTISVIPSLGGSSRVSTTSCY